MLQIVLKNYGFYPYKIDGKFGPVSKNALINFQEKNNLQCVFSADNDKYACETYNLNFSDYPLVDITQLDPKKMPDHEILCGGFPCQPFSIGGYRKGFDDKRGNLFFQIMRLVDEMDSKPNVLFL